jgi:hypothetical protein
VTTPERMAIVDRARSASLADMGSPGYDLAMVVDRDGESYPVLVRRSDIGRLDVGFSRDFPEHERDDGPLPEQTAKRIAE